MHTLRTFALAFALLALSASTAPGAVAAKAKPTCKRAHATAVAGNRDAVVFTRPTGDDYTQGTSLYGCSRRTGRVHELAYAFDDDYVSSAAFGLVRLRGLFVAFYAESYDISCKAACDPGYDPYRRSLHVIDLRTGAGAGARIAERPAGGRLLLDAHGAIAWPRWLPGNQVEVRVLDAAGERAIDSGAIRPESLTLSRNGRLTWVNDTTPRAAQLKRFTT